MEHISSCSFKSKAYFNAEMDADNSALKTPTLSAKRHCLRTSVWELDISLTSKKQVLILSEDPSVYKIVRGL